MFSALSKMKVKYTMAALWKWKPFLFLLSISSFLAAAWIIPTSHAWIENFDRTVYLNLSSFVAKHPYWQTFWALANHYYSNDLVFDAVILGFAYFHIFKSPKHLTAHKIAEILFIALMMAFTIIVIQKLVIQDLFLVRRKSPASLNPLSYMLSELTTWIKIRNKSAYSFPSGHATSALFFVFSIFSLMGTRKGLIASVFGLYLILPRLIIGGHWLSDVICGSLPIALASTAISYFTPLFHVGITLLKKAIYFFAPQLHPAYKKELNEKRNTL